MEDDFIPKDEQRSSADRWVRTKDWPEAKVDGQKVNYFRARLISKITAGYEVWGDDGKPYRAKTKAGLSHIKPRQDGKFGPDKVNEIWAGLFLDVDADVEKVWTFSLWGVKSGLRSAIAEWGKPEDGTIFPYDFVFQKGQEKGKTVYSVKVADASKGTARYALKPEQVERINALFAAGFDLESIFDGGDPFPQAADGGASSVPDSGDLPF